MEVQRKLSGTTSSTTSIFTWRRNLALYPECANEQDLSLRQACCDGKVQSAAGREFCYNEITHAVGTFAKCDFPTYTAMFECCEETYADNQYLEFDCKTNLPGGGDCVGNDCFDNYTEAVKEVEAEKTTITVKDDDDDGMDPAIIVVIALTPLLLLLLFISIKTRCFK